MLGDGCWVMDVGSVRFLLNCSVTKTVQNLLIEKEKHQKMETYDYNEPQNNENQPYDPNYRSEKKLAAGILAILLGSLGIHKFYLGYTKEGIILLLSTLIILPVLTLFTCGFASAFYPVVFIVPIVEGIIYLTMKDEQFDNTYIRNQKPWL